MQKAGKILALLGGIIGLIMAFITFFFEGIGKTVGGSGATISIFKRGVS